MSSPRALAVRVNTRTVNQIAVRYGVADGLCVRSTLAEIMAVIGPSTALATMFAFSAPVASTRQRLHSRIVPTPIVIARLGTRSAEPNNGAFCAIVVGVNAFSRVRERKAESGSLN